MNSLCAVIAGWLNASQSSRVGVGINRFAMTWAMKCKHSEQSIRLDTTLY